MLGKWGMERLAIDTVSVHQFPFYFIGFFFFSREPDNVHEPLKKTYRVFLILTYQVWVKHVPTVSNTIIQIPNTIN